MKKIDWKNLIDEFKKFFKNLGKVVIIITAIASGYAASEIYHRYERGIIAHKMQEPKTIKETSAAINERGELVIFDRRYGTYQIYSDSVGKVIFNLYATKIYYTQKGIE
jgi:hypothetical protein